MPEELPRRRRLIVSLVKKPSTAFSHNTELGMKWKHQRGCFPDRIPGGMHDALLQSHILHDAS